MPDVSLPTGAVRAPRGPKGGRGFPRGRGRAAPSQFVAHDLEAKTRTEDVVSSENREKTFADLLLSPPVYKGLTNAGFIRPSPVQLQAIPPAKVGFDCIVQSKSGTGKTCVYVVTALEMVKQDLNALQVLVLAPTREIAVQGVNVAQQIGQYMPNIKIQAFIGGLSLNEDKIRAKNCQICVGTPGRIKQLISESLLNVENVRLAVLDEADKMLEPSFINDTTWILNSLPSSKQVVALSATYPDKLASLAERFMRSPHHIRPGLSSQVLTGIAQFVMKVQHCPVQQKQNTIKQSALLAVLSAIPYTQVLVFSNYTSIAQATADFLNSRGFPAVYMAAVQDQARRMAVMETFRQFNCRILCSTDLTARGIDAENVNLVVNMEVPWEHNTYLHRIGRGGRFGSQSVSVTLASEGKELRSMQMMVAKTGSKVKILDKENIPSNVRAEMENMEELEAIAEEPDDKEEGDNKSIPEESQGKQPKKSRNRGKKKPSSNQINTPDESIQDQDEKDEALLRDNLSLIKSQKPKNIPTWDQVMSLSENLEAGDTVDDHISNTEFSLGPETHKQMGAAISRISQKNNEKIEERLRVVRSKTNNLSIKDMMSLLENRINVMTFNNQKESENVEKVLGGDGEDVLEESEDSESSSSSESDSSSNSSSSDLSSDSESSDSSDEEQPNYSQQIPFQNPPNSHQNHDWYRQWYASVQQQRYSIQMQEYYRYLQYYGYK